MVRLKELRKAKGESQASVARVLNITQQAYANYESGKRTPDIKSLQLLARHYGVSVECLLDDMPLDEKAPAPEIQSERDEDEDAEIREYLQQIKDDPSTRMMFDLAKGATLEEIKATVAFLKALREQK